MRFENNHVEAMVRSGKFSLVTVPSLHCSYRTTLVSNNHITPALLDAISGRAPDWMCKLAGILFSTNATHSVTHGMVEVSLVHEEDEDEIHVVPDGLRTTSISLLEKATVAVCKAFNDAVTEVRERTPIDTVDLTHIGDQANRIVVEHVSERAMVEANYRRKNAVQFLEQDIRKQFGSAYRLAVLKHYKTPDVACVMYRHTSTGTFTNQRGVSQGITPFDPVIIDGDEVLRFSLGYFFRDVEYPSSFGSTVEDACAVLSLYLKSVNTDVVRREVNNTTYDWRKMLDEHCYSRQPLIVRK